MTNQRRQSSVSIPNPRLSSELCHRVINLAASTIHAPNRGVRRQAMPGIEHHPFPLTVWLAIVEPLPRDFDGPNPLIGRVVPLDRRVLDRCPPIVDVELHQEVARRFLLMQTCG